MTERALTLAQLFISSIWRIATGFNLPGVNFNFAEFIFFIIFFGLVLRTFFTVLSVLGHKNSKGK